eukprot:11043304-Lingulodinium_polyedra.AAC.1
MSPRLLRDIAAGHSVKMAKRKEYSRQRMAKRRAKGLEERAKERLELERAWHAEFDSVPAKESEFQKVDEPDPGAEDEEFGMETEVVESRTVNEQRNSTKQYRRLTKKEIEKHTQFAEANEDELQMPKPRSWEKPAALKKRGPAAREHKNVMRARRRRTDRRKRIMCRFWKAGNCKRGDKCEFSHEVVEDQEGARESDSSSSEVPPEDLSCLGSSESETPPWRKAALWRQPATGRSHAASSSSRGGGMHLLCALGGREHSKEGCERMDTI